MCVRQKSRGVTSRRPTPLAVVFFSSPPHPRCSRQRRSRSAPVRSPKKKQTDAQRTRVLFVFEAIIQHSAPPRDRRAEQLLAHLALSTIFFGNHIVTFIAFFSPPLHLVLIVLMKKKIELNCPAGHIVLNCC